MINKKREAEDVRVVAYRNFLRVLGVEHDAPAHRIAFNIAWHAAVESVGVSDD